ncbi:aminoglycoside phosphotransferase family protein [Litorihabitans aurantiacus]|uniref:Aminoglycoside phosphotransferase n=1 Tax=Litorihabitans aurantiacus TaxID=1930061 RepID=A0AA37XDZ2_9MICO|nr:aminoglycoside phosphotransferase family protein [Litorihabitans aurantiacus]GMA31428.1 aminoglycoside phosphotransferase [Litorihabitans aurantiacus]
MKPGADVVIDLDLVRLLLREQHPDLAELPLAPSVDGWDNVTVRLGDELAVRLPRRAVAVALLGHEQRWLPEIAPLLPVAVPVPVRTGTPSAAFERPWSVVPWIDGERAADAPRASRTAWAADLATALAALHVPAPAGAPHNPVRAVPLADRDSAVAPRLTGAEWARVREIWRAGVAAPAWAGPPVWVHGDPHPGNVLVRRRPDRLAALIDFGDLSAGDHSCDLAAAWLHLDAVGRVAFTDTYDALRPAADPGRWERAAAWAVAMASAVVVMASDDDANAGWAHEALTELADGGSTPQAAVSSRD